VVDVRTMTPNERYELHELVLAFAERITKSRGAAENLAQEAFLRFMTTRPWDPLGKTSLERHMCGIVKSLLWAERTSKRSEIERLAAAEHALLAEGGRSAEAMSLDRAEREEKEALASQRSGKLRAMLKGRTLELLVLDVMQDEGLRKPAELATRTKKSAVAIDAALRRIRRTMKRIVAAERGEDDGAMQDEAEDEEVAQ
jgi:DNA-directed RNA polymerase specialized sigma24 family protein